jgi:hypothetical protein
MEEIKTRICTKCHVEKPLTQFSKDPHGKDGLKHECKLCRHERYLEENPNRKHKIIYLPSEGFKVCPKCKIEKPLSEFSEDKRSKWDGLSCYCKECWRDRQRNRRKNKTCADHDREICKNNMRKRRKDSEYRKYIKSYLSVWRNTPSGKLSKSKRTHKRRVKAKGLRCDLTLRQWNKILKMQLNKCAICKKEFCDDLLPTKDHIIPLSSIWCYGLTFGNTQALCGSCNSSKRDNFYLGRAIDEILVDI